MLVLSRKAGQELVLGDNVRITITKISGNRVTLGVTAPDSVRIIRGELEPIVKAFEGGEIEVEVATEADEDDAADPVHPGFVLRHGGPLAGAANQLS